jgi:hypothetical protein
MRAPLFVIAAYGGTDASAQQNGRSKEAQYVASSRGQAGMLQPAIGGAHGR